MQGGGDPGGEWLVECSSAVERTFGPVRPQVTAGLAIDQAKDQPALRAVSRIGRPDDSAPIRTGWRRKRPARISAVDSSPSMLRAASPWPGPARSARRSGLAAPRPEAEAETR